MKQMRTYIYTIVSPFVVAAALLWLSGYDFDHRCDELASAAGLAFMAALVGCTFIKVNRSIV